MLALSPVATLTESAQPVLERHIMADGERSARAKARFDQVQEERALLNSARENRNEKASFADRGKLYREESDGRGGVIRTPDPALQKAEAEVAQREKRLARLLAFTETPAMTADKLVAHLQRGVEYVDVGREFKLAKGESKPVALTRIRNGIAALRAERKAVANAPLPLADVRAALRDEIAALAAKGQPKTLSMFHGGGVEMPAGRLPNKSPLIQYFGDGVAFTCFMLGVDAVMQRLDPLIEFNADPEHALSESDKAKRLAAIDAQLETLGREEAALVEAIIAEGGTAHHRPDANVLHVLGIAVAE